ncbi:MAG: GcrA family cell cycle regulator [Proteobacteria bacterium]|nr:GcrA family cell cycle regulator [Pseudomonadota bacterium]
MAQQTNSTSNGNGTHWTPAMVKRLKEMYAKRMTRSEIASRLGISRGAVSGKLNRMLKKGEIPSRPARPTESPAKKPVVRLTTNAKKEIVPLLQRRNLPQRLQLRNINWSRTSCSWPIGDPKASDFHFCGEAIVPGRPYCETHCLVAYTNLRDSA